MWGGVYRQQEYSKMHIPFSIMLDLYSDFEDLAHTLQGKNYLLIRTAIEIVYLQGQLKVYVEGINSDISKRESNILVLKNRIDFLIKDFADQTLGFS